MVKKSKRSQKRVSTNKILEGLAAANKEHAKEEKLSKRKQHQQTKMSSPPAGRGGVGTVKVTCEGGSNDAIPSAFSSSMMVADEKDDVVSIKLLLRNLWSYLEMSKKRTILIPTPIQLQSWPVLLKQSRDKVAACTLNLIGIAPTGSGKTLAYGIPMVTMCVGMRLSTAGIYGLVLAPTRELAIQIGTELTLASYGLPSTALKIVTIHGGVDALDQIGHLSKCKKMPMILVATPGRLVGLIEYEKRLRNWLLTVKMVVLDEADRLAIHKDMAEQVDTILGCTHLPRICLYSATYPREVNTKWNEWASVPRICIKVNTMSVGEAKTTPKDKMKSSSPRADEQKEPAAEGNAGTRPTDISKVPSHISQLVRICEKSEKSETLFTTLTSIRAKERNARQKTLCIIFFDQIKTLQNIFKRMVREGIGAQCAEFHGQLSQAARQKTLANFKCGKITTLLATDIVARGIHVNNVELVINYDFPESLDQYVHRCGRAGRSNAAGKNKPPPKAVVHSFLTRGAGVAMAKKVLALLRGSMAWIDPKLLEFAGGSSDNSFTNAGEEDEIKEKKAKRRKV